MAVLRSGQVVNLTAAADALSGTLIVQAMFAGGAGTLQSGGVTVWQPTAAGQYVEFPGGQQFDGLTKSAGTSNLFIYLV